MKRSGITRRDFLAGSTLPVLAGSWLSPGALLAATGAGSGVYYPPALTGLRGSHPGSFEVAHALARNGQHWPRPERQTDDDYDLVVVGGGISGLAAAYLFRQRVGAGARILILDNHDDFGGHAKRNEFSVDGRTLLGYGGSQSIDSPATYSKVARELLVELGVETERFYRYYDRDFETRNGLGRGVLFQQPHFSATRLVADAAAAPDAAERRRRLEGYPLSAAARAALDRLYAGELADTDAVRAMVADPHGTPVERFLLAACAMPEEALVLLRPITHTFWGFGIEGLSLAEILEYESLGPGLNAGVEMLARRAGLAEPMPPGFADHGEEPYIFHFPDGNASIARLLVRSLVPGALPGSSMEDVVTARLDYARLDRPENATRVRLNSTAVDARNVPGGVEVTYVRGGTAERVRARNAILACYNNMAAHLCPDMSDAQRAALDYPEKIPLAVVNVALRNWRPIAASGIHEVYAPGGLLVRMGLDFPVSLGDYHYARDPDQPVVLDCWHAGIDPDVSAHPFERLREGRRRMLERSFDEYEAGVREGLAAAWGGHGFDADRDIAGITVNRWPHGYAWEYTDLWDDPSWSRGAGPHVIGRQQVGRISIANSDSEAFAYVNGAIDAAYRAVREQTT
ncbi:MAG: FAD-dependent oxidoreductase [Pseudomonadales bacterium]